MSARSRVSVASALAALVSVPFLIAPEIASAAPTLLTVGHVNRHPTATWSLPSGVESAVVEAATSPAMASDGYFFDENLVAFDVPEPTQTSWVDGSQREPGTYYVHVAGYEPGCLECPVREWSNILVLTIPAPPPNRRPRIVSSHFSLVGHTPSGAGYYVTVNARYRVCDDSRGRLLTRVRETKTNGGSFLFASAQWSYRPFAPAAFSQNCKTYRKQWRLRDRFFGVGSYRVRLHVRDGGGKWSNTVSRAWFTSD